MTQKNWSVLKNRLVNKIIGQNWFNSSNTPSWPLYMLHSYVKILQTQDIMVHQCTTMSSGSRSPNLQYCCHPRITHTKYQHLYRSKGTGDAILGVEGGVGEQTFRHMKQYLLSHSNCGQKWWLPAQQLPWISKLARMVTDYKTYNHIILADINNHK